MLFRSCFGKKGTRTAGPEVLSPRNRVWPIIPWSPSHRPSLQGGGKLGQGGLLSRGCDTRPWPHPSTTCRKLTGPAALACCPSSCLGSHGSPGRSKSLAGATPNQSRLDMSSCLPAAPAPIPAPLTARRRKKRQQLRETRRAQPGYGNHKGRPSPSQAGMLTWSPARVFNCCSRHLARTGLAQEGVGCSGRLAR